MFSAGRDAQEEWQEECVHEIVDKPILARYRDAVSELSEAVKQLSDGNTDLEAAIKRVDLAKRRCDALRLELSNPEASAE